MALRADDVDLGRDRALVERFQTGDQRAFDELYDRYFARLTRYCRKRVADGATAEEIAQEAFARAYQKMNTLQGERKFYPWMTVIAGRLCVDHHRKASRTELSDEIDLGVSHDDLGHLDDAVDIAYLHAALDNLAPRHREVLEMRETEELTYAQIAERLDVNQGVVEQLLHRARKALRREFSKVSGETLVGRLAGIPGLLWVARRFQSMRSRMSEIGFSAAPVAVGALSLAFVAGPTVLTDDAAEPVRTQVASVQLTNPASNAALADAVALGAARATRAAATQATLDTPTSDRGHLEPLREEILEESEQAARSLKENMRPVHDAADTGANADLKDPQSESPEQVSDVADTVLAPLR